MNKTNAWLGILIFALAGCSQSPVETQIPTGMNLGWKSLPHRIAATELTTKLSSETPTITVQNDGGDFGAMDTATANYQTIAIAHPGLVIEEVSATFVIEPSTDPAAIDAYLQSQSLTLPASLNGSDNLAVFVRGFRIDTNLYETEPDFQTAEDLPYDPALGYTTGGFGMGSSDPVRTDSGWTIDVFARNRLAISDREDMNAAIEQATTWVRVDYLVMGLPEDVTLSRAETNYALSYPDFGSQTDHPHADAEKQTIVFDAQSNTDVLGFGIQSFDLSINVDGTFDSNCEVVSEEVNFWNQEINGPGRYLREFTTAISDVAPQNDGSVKALFDLHISNSSAMNEVGNICAGLSGKALLLRTPGATTPTIVNRRLQFESGITLEDSLND